MTLRAGDKLGPYEIVAPIGAGGMGEVYKATDTRLDRVVAVKVLPEHIAKREDLRARFEREARAVASLNHPHICVLYDIGSHEGVGYMVMEYLDGETLAARLAKAAPPLDLAVKFGIEIADALDRAHRAGVTHRDVKPGNIVITRDGVKLLDFGLAKSSVAPGPNDATLTAALTSEGQLLGTPQYMAPEQFEGREADARSDIWAFGAVLHEMIGGRKTFEGKNYSGLVGAILANEPAAIGPGWVDRIVRRCLAKDPEDRYQAMRDVVLDLRTPPVVEAAVVAAPKKKMSWVWALVGIVVGALSMWRPAAAPVATVIEVPPPEGERFGFISDNGGSVISPDGRMLAYVGTKANSLPMLYVRFLNELEPKLIPGTEGAGRPFWSPDSKSIGFGTRGKLKRVDLSGGVPVALCDVRYARGGTWTRDGYILFGDQGKGIQRVPAAGGNAEAVTTVDTSAGESSHYYPQILPDGKRLLIHIRASSTERQGIYIAGFDGKPLVKILQTDYRAVYEATSKRLFYVEGDARLVAKSFQLDPPALSGDPVTIAPAVGRAGINGYADFSVSETGTIAYKPNIRPTRGRFRWLDRSGKTVSELGAPEGATTNARISPDEKRIAYIGIANGLSGIWHWDVPRGVRSPFVPGNAALGMWSQDGQHYYYQKDLRIFRKRFDGAGGEEVVIEDGRAGAPRDISSDGRWLVYGVGDIFVAPLAGERKPKPYLNTNSTEIAASLSPDGRWLAYSTDESGRSEIYIAGFPERKGVVQVSPSGGRHAIWRADGKEIVWLSADNTLQSADVTITGETVAVGPARSHARLDVLTESTQFQLSRDGKRIFFAAYDQIGIDKPLVIIQNWAAKF
jgi:Tol biopolymer transport system component